MLLTCRDDALRQLALLLATNETSVVDLAPDVVAELVQLDNHRIEAQPLLVLNAKPKYSVYVRKHGRKRLIHFGDKSVTNNFATNWVTTVIILDHNDSKRRKRYYDPHGPSDDKYTAKYWSHKILW